MPDSSPRRPPLDTPPEPASPARVAEADGIDAVTTARGQTTEIELTRAQHTFARRAAESQATIPQLTLRGEVDLEACLAQRDASGVEPTCTEELVKACALALREHPRVNSTYRDGRVLVHSRINVGLAVSNDSGEPGTHDSPAHGPTMIVPTVFDADTLAAAELGHRIDDLRAHAHAGTLTPPQLSGATFTVVDLGTYGVDEFTATVQPGQTAILAVGSVRPRPVASDDGGVVVHRTAMLTLNCDHRVLYGADAARFLARVRELLEAPAGSYTKRGPPPGPA
jgi:pyruvate dehydrogenase E2 component (dihydrolipoyllysine-residue acetyltransferase)